LAHNFCIGHFVQGCGEGFQNTRQTRVGFGEQFGIFTSQVRKRLAKNIARVSEKDKKKKNSPGWHFFLAIPEFYSYLASWRVVIRTPVVL
jgi:hypothetical protein